MTEITYPDAPRPKSASFHGKVAIVTGAGSHGDGIGNGRATAILLSEQGCSVVCVDINLAWAERTVEMIASEAAASTASKAPDEQPGRAIAIQADVTKAADCERAVQQTIETFGRLDILVNIVGTGGATGTAVTVDVEAWEQSMTLNVTSMVLMSKYSIPAMLTPKATLSPSDSTTGSIVHMGSVAGLKGGTPHLLYPTSKGAVVNLTRAMAAHHARDGIRVNCVCPGMLYTPMMYATEAGMSEDARRARRERSLLGTEGNAWDAACAVRFLAGGEARWVTGVVLPVDAGTTAAVGMELPKAASVGA